jgi:mannose-1-phosphate guanylyltransferase
MAFQAIFEIIGKRDIRVKRSDEMERNQWVILLAGDDDRWLSMLARDDLSLAIPRPFCRVKGKGSLLRQALQRAMSLVPKENILIVVNEQNEDDWRPQLADFPEENILVQPAHRGSGPGILWALLKILKKSWDAQIIIMPAGHFISESESFKKTLQQALKLDEELYDQIILLGIRPDCSETNHAWIIPGPANDFGTHNVQRLSRGEGPEKNALWNSFHFVVTARTLYGLFRKYAPKLLGAFVSNLPLMRGGHEKDVLPHLFNEISSCEFPNLISKIPTHKLSVLEVPPCGWNDLETPQRFLKCVESKKEARVNSEKLQMA